MLCILKFMIFLGSIYSVVFNNDHSNLNISSVTLYICYLKAEIDQLHYFSPAFLSVCSFSKIKAASFPVKFTSLCGRQIDQMIYIYFSCKHDNPILYSIFSFALRIFSIIFVSYYTITFTNIFLFQDIFLTKFVRTFKRTERQLLDIWY